MESSKDHFGLEFHNKKQLRNAFMPFVKNGGIFIHTDKSFDLGDNITLTIHLLEVSEKYESLSKVVWLNPKFAQGNLPQGIGVQFLGENARLISQRIESLIAGLPQEEPTDTM